MSTLKRCNKCGNSYVDNRTRDTTVIHCPCGGVARIPDEAKKNDHDRHVRRMLREENRQGWVK